MTTHTRLAVAALALGLCAVAPGVANAHDNGRHGHGRGHAYGHQRHYGHSGYYSHSRYYAPYRYSYRYAPTRYVYVRRAPRVIYYDDYYPAYRYYPRPYAYAPYPRNGLTVSLGYADGPYYGGYTYRRW